jgi:hypothetical protein
VRLAGAGRALHDHAVVAAQPLHDAHLLRVGRQREQRVGAEHLASMRRRPASSQASRSPASIEVTS